MCHWNTDTSGVRQTSHLQKLKQYVLANWDDGGMRCCAVEGICVVWHIWSSLLFSLENSWSLAVHHSIYHQCFVIICRNSHKVEFSVDILCCDSFRDFYNMPKTNADSWMILLTAQRKVKALSFFETNPGLQPCPPWPWKASGITQWTRLERDHHYICNRKFKEVLLGERSLWAGDETLHWASFQTGSSSSQVTQQDKWISTGCGQEPLSAGWAGETYVSIEIADVTQICLYSCWYLVTNATLV